MPVARRSARVAGWWPAIAAALFGIAMAALRPVPTLDLDGLDLGFRAVRFLHPTAPATELVVVGIDEATLHDWAEPLALMHRHLGALLQALAAGGARAVAVDVVLPERSYDAIAPGYDAALLEGILAMRAVGPVVLAKTFDDAGDERAIHRPFLAAAGTAGNGFAVLTVDGDGKVRRIGEALGAGDDVVPTFIGQLASALRIEVRPSLIDFTHPIGGAAISLRTVLEWARNDDTQALRAAFANKVVFIGALLPFTDRHRIPVAVVDAFPASATPGVLIHAQALHGLVLGRSIVERIVPSMLFSALLCLVLWRGSTTWIRTILWLAIGIAACVGLTIAALVFGTAIPVGNAALAMMVCAVARISFEVGSELLARRRLRQAFAGYVSPAVMTELEAGRLDGLASGRKHLCVMFMDIRGFTKRTETESPEAVLSMLRLHFEAVTRVVHRNGGTVKEFEGDGVVALFGAPLDLDNPEQAAFDTARTALEELGAVNRSLADSSHAPITIGIGLASGVAVVGNIGASTRYTYGAIGDCVNLASRLEGLTKVLSVPVLMNATVAAKVDVRDMLVDFGVQPIAGHESVRVFGWRVADSAAST